MTEVEFTKIYKESKQNCINFLHKKNYGKFLNDSEIEGIYHDSCIVLWEKSLTEEFELTCSSQTYLYSVCRNIFLGKLKESEKEQVLKNERKVEELGGVKVNGMIFIEIITDVLDPLPNQNEPLFCALEKAMQVLKKSGGKCFELLTLFFYQKKTMIELTEHFAFTNKDNTKNQKARCQKRLKTYAFNFLKECREEYEQ